MMKHNGPLKTLGPQAAQLVTSLHEDNKLVFRLEDVQRILSLEEPTTRSLVRTLVNRGVAARLKPGLFTLVPFELGREREYLGNPFIVARELAGGKDYFLSHGTAMSIHGMVTQPQLVVHVTTTAPRRPSAGGARPPVARSGRAPDRAPAWRRGSASAARGR